MNMKTTDMIRSFAALMTGCVFCMLSCTDPVEDPGQDPTPEPGKVEPAFPALYEDDAVAPGSTVTLTASPNMDWEASVPESTLQWFWIEDGSFNVDKVSGKAGDVILQIGVSSTEEFDNERSCEVTMTMGGKSQVIARLVRPAKEKSLKVYVAKVIDDEIQFVEDGSAYDYESEEAERISLFWTGSEFRLPVKVESNFSWTVQLPEWASIDVPENAAGVSDVIVHGVPSAYPLEDTEDKVRFMYGETVIKEYAIAIPGCKDKFSYSVEMALTELDFNYNGYIKTPMGYVEGPVSAEIYGTSGTAVFAVELVDGKYDIASAHDPMWLTVSDEPYDQTDGADVLQTRQVTITASVNEGDDRQAVIFFLPPEGWTKDDGLFNETLDAVREEYRQYAVHVIQHSSDQEFIQMLSDASDMAAGGATFAVSEDEGLYTMFGPARYAYELTYTDQYARDNARMAFASAVTRYGIYDETGEDKTGDDSFFLTMTMYEDMTVGLIDMVSDVRSVGYVVLYGSTDNILAVVKCVFDPEEIIGEVEDVAFTGESADYAEKVGATLEKLTEGTLYNQYNEGDALVYHLTYRMTGMPMRITIPNTVVSHTVNPYVFKNYIRVNDNIYDEVFVNNKLGGIELIGGGVDIYMDMPEGRNKLRGNIIFMNSANETVLVLICTLDLTGSAE